jgi:hypothetical protein
VKPAELALPQTDPLELGRQALQVLSQMKLEGLRQRDLREEAMELVRQLAWGPAK